MFRRFTATKPVVSRIGERAKPHPKGQPGYIRIDTVHQGDFNGGKGIYHINAVDEITQWEIVASVERISEAYLVETKNGSVLGKNLGYAHIPQACAELLNEYHKGFLNPYINFHRPCFFPVSVIDHRGRIKKTYPYEEVMTLYERLKSVPRAGGYPRPGVTLEKLGTIANQMSANQFAERMVNARSKFLQQITRFANWVA